MNQQMCEQVFAKRPGSNVLVGAFGNGVEVREFQTAAAADDLTSYLDSLRPRGGWSHFAGAIPEVRMIIHPM